MGGPVTRTKSAVLGRLPFTSDFRDFHTHGPRMRIGELSAPSGSFVARASASVTTVDRCLGGGWAFPAADNAFASFLAAPTEVGTGSAEVPAAATTVGQPTSFLRSSTQETDSGETAGPTVSAPVPPGPPAPPTAKPSLDRISTRTRRRTAIAAGNAPPAVDYGFGLGRALRPPARRANTFHGRGRPPPPPRPLLLPPRRS